MKKQKILIIGLSTLLPFNTIMPYNIISNVQAKETADKWIFENKNTPDSMYVKSSSFANSRIAVSSFSNSVIPKSFNVPEKNFLGEPIKYVGFTNLIGKGIQYVSFIETKELMNIGYIYIYTGSGSTSYAWKNYNVFENNEIRKIYWNSDDFYVNDITIDKSSFINNKIQNLDLPNKVVSINDSAFKNNEISWIEGWDNLTELGPNAFYKNKLVSSLPNGYEFNLPKKLTTIKSNVFFDNELTHVTIPENILSIEALAFGKNKISSIYFENSNTIIPNNILSDGGSATDLIIYSSKLDPNTPIIVYGHGETSTAKTFASRSERFIYVNVDQYEHVVFDAEESKTQEKIDQAYEKINEMTDGEMKDKYLYRLNQIGFTFEIEKYVYKAENTLTKEDYEIALDKVNEIDSSTLKIPYINRLELVLKAINNKTFNDIKDSINDLGDNISLEQLNKFKDELEGISGIEGTSDLINGLDSKKSKAEINSYKYALSYVEFTKNYQTLKNVTEAQKAINVLEEGFKLNENITYTDDNEYLLDSNNEKIINSESSYKKINVDGVETFEKDSNGDYILKDGLTGPIYILNPNFGQEITITEETGSKQHLQDLLDEFDEYVYAKYAVELAEKKLEQEVLDNALILTISLDNSDKKDELLDKIQDIQDKIDSFSEIKEEVAKIISKYDNDNSDSSYNEALNLINSINSESIKKQYKEKLDNIKYKNQVEEIINYGNEFGLTTSKKDELLIKLSLLDSYTENYDKLNDDSLRLITEYQNYNKVYSDILNKIDKIDVKDKNSLTTTVYTNLRNEIFNIKHNNPNKVELNNKLNELYNALNKLAEESELNRLLYEEIDLLNTKTDSVSIDELKDLYNRIQVVSNPNDRSNLKEKYNELIENIFDSYLLPEYLKPGNTTKEFKDNVLSYLNLITDTTLKEKLKKQLSDDLKDLLINKIGSTSVEELINGKMPGGFELSIDDLVKLIDANSQGDILTLIDDKVIDFVNDKYDPSSPNYIGSVEKTDLSLLSELYDMIEDLSKKTSAERVVQDVVNQYFTENYPNYDINNYDLKDYRNMNDIINNFDGIHFANISQDKIDNAIYKSIEDNSNVVKNLTEIGSIVNQDLRDQLYNSLSNNFSDYLQSFDLSKRNSLESLTDLSSSISEIKEKEGDSESANKLDNILKQYITNNSEAIYKTSVQNNSQRDMIDFLNQYLSEDELNNLIENDQDNVIGVQNNKEEYYQDIINKLEGDVNRLYESLNALEELLNTTNNINGGFDVNNEVISGGKGSGLNYGYSSISTDYQKELLKEFGIIDELNDNKETIETLKDEIKKLREENEDLFLENMVALKAASLADDEDIQEQLKAYKEGNKSLNKMLIVLGSSMWLLILLGLMYVANINLRNKKVITELKEELKESKELIKENEMKNKENMDELYEKIEKLINKKDNNK